MQPTRTERGTFAPGISGNPNGRPPKGQAMAELLRAFGDAKYGGRDQTRRERALEVIWEQACKGNLAALAWIADRTEGKVTDRVQHVGATGPTPGIDLSRLSPEQLDHFERLIDLATPSNP